MMAEQPSGSSKPTELPLVLAITGASGAVIALRLLQVLEHSTGNTVVLNRTQDEAPLLIPRKS